MVRIVIIGIVIAVAFTLYALVDAAMTDHARARGVSKPVWVVIVVLLPVIGGVLWFLIGKGQMPVAAPKPPDDDPRFSGNRMSTDDLDDHMRDLEARLRELDDETFPGEQSGKGKASGTSESRPAKPVDAPDDQAGSGDGPTAGDAGGAGETGEAEGPSGPDSGTPDGTRKPNGSGSRPDGDSAQP